MFDAVRTLGFGVTFDSVTVGTHEGQTVSLSSHECGDENPPHRHVNDYVCLVLSGGFVERQRNSWRERPKGSFFIHRAGEIHHDRFGSSGAICLSLHMAAGQARPNVEEGLCSTRARLVVDELAFELMAHEHRDLPLASLTAELVAELGASEGDERNDKLQWIDQVVEAISDDPLRRWRLDELATIARRHPVRMTQAFRAKTGLSISAFQRRRRLLSLSLALRHGTTPLSALAAEYGYCDQSHMNSEFRRAFGTSPKKYRGGVH